MESKRKELLEYIRLLYERQSSASSKAGVTLWAVLAGLVYLLWNTFDSLLSVQEIKVFKDSFYYYFGNIVVALFALTMLASYRGVLKGKRNYDYRLYKKGAGGIGFLLVVLAFSLIPIYFSFSSEPLEDNNYYAFQRLLNFWFFVSIFVLFGLSSILSFFKNHISEMPSPDNFALEDSWFQIAVYSVLLIVIIELFVGNLVVVAVGFYSSGYDPIAIRVAFNLSLIILAIFFLFSRGSEKDRLGFLARLERDIVIHDIEPRVILERLQGELLGSYIGDWLGEKLKEVKECAEEVVLAARKSNEVAQEIESIDVAYERERRGRLDEYLQALAAREEQFLAASNPVIKWLEAVAIQLQISRDDFIGVLVKESLSDLKNCIEEVGRELSVARGRISGVKEL
ncbi:hypothetical protein [Billgrantia sp. C5P2]|uniref:hypothetical protein n=1 Tax=Billgrantia sp. C5P2 TaxID=3436239 RepID=UPI003DA65EF4